MNFYKLSNFFRFMLRPLGADLDGGGGLDAPMQLKQEIRNTGTTRVSAI